MAVDEAILETTVEDPSRPATLRWYRWLEPTVSLGYFQAHRERPPELTQLPFVRRITGGGAILHDQELTYSLILPAGTWSRETAQALVQQFHHCFVEAIEDHLSSALCSDQAIASEESAYLCFRRRSPTDVVAGKDKVLGSAQRLRRGALLQHGSILLARSAYAPDLAGLYDRQPELATCDLVDAISDRLACKRGLDCQVDKLSDAECQRAIHLSRTKYEDPRWNEAR